MITLTIEERVKVGKSIEVKRKIVICHSLDKAKKIIMPIVKEMKVASVEKRIPQIRIDGVSYDTKSERALLLELDAIKSIDNETDNGY